MKFPRSKKWGLPYWVVFWLYVAIFVGGVSSVFVMLLAGQNRCVDFQGWYCKKVLDWADQYA